MKDFHQQSEESKSTSQDKKTASQTSHSAKQRAIRQNILEMLRLQDRINTQITPEWRLEKYPWYRAAWIECAELMDHHGWKWWKHETPDHEQIHLELVDIWHFGLSDCLQHSQDLSLTADALYRSVYLVSLVPSTKPLLEATEIFTKDCLQLRRFPTLSFAQLIASAGLCFHKMTRLYLGKNTLNSFRQDHGYKSGEYKKFWSGKEDNEHLYSILDELDTDLDSKALQTSVYTALKNSYLEPAEG